MAYTTDPKDERINKTKPNGQREAYLILPQHEIDKGFIRPVFGSYVHVGRAKELCGEGDQYAQGYLCALDKDHSGECVKTTYFKDVNIIRGLGVYNKLNECDHITQVTKPIAETLARDPKFYKELFCAHCKEHKNVNEFVWLGTNITVGS